MTRPWNRRKRTSSRAESYEHRPLRVVRGRWEGGRGFSGIRRRRPGQDGLVQEALAADDADALGIHHLAGGKEVHGRQLNAIAAVESDLAVIDPFRFREGLVPFLGEGKMTHIFRILFAAKQHQGCYGNNHKMLDIHIHKLCQCISRKSFGESITDFCPISTKIAEICIDSSKKTPFLRNDEFPRNLTYGAGLALDGAGPRLLGAGLILMPMPAPRIPILWPPLAPV